MKINLTLLKFFLLISLSPNALGYTEQYVPVTTPPESVVIEKKEEDTTDVKLEEYGLDLRYRAGKHLIYDCDRGFYVCVDDVSRDNCNFRREKQEMHKNNSLSCAFFKTYPDKKTCVLEQYKMMEKKLKPVFCFRKHL